MSAATLNRAASGTAERRAVVVQPVTFLRVLHAECIKVRSLRSTKITLAVAVVLMAGIGLMSAAITVSQWSRLPATSRTNAFGRDFNRATASLTGVASRSSP